MPTMQKTTQKNLHSTRPRLQGRRLGERLIMLPLLIVIGSLTVSVSLLTWRLYQLEKAQHSLARIKFLEYYKDVPLFHGIDRDE